MIVSSLLLLLLLLLFFIINVNANEHYEIGIINHETKWYIHCLQNNTQIINPPLNDQEVLVPYQCPYPALSIDILPIEIDFTFVCRIQSRLIWIIIDLYQYNTWPQSINPDQLNISLIINEQIHIKDYKSEINQFKTRFIVINAFYIPFESLDIVSNASIDIFVQINHCRFSIKENSTWHNILHNNCHSIESNTLHVHKAQCDFIPKSKPIETSRDREVEIADDNTTNLPDFHVILSIDQQKTIETTTEVYDYASLFDGHYHKLLLVIRRAAHLITFILIFTTMILIVLIIFFLYILCYHNYRRAMRKSSLLI